jgi:hypothetical protein
MYITKEQITADMSPMAVEAMQETTDLTVQNLINNGLIQPELCLIALDILDRFSEDAKGLLKLQIRASATIADADRLLAELTGDL